MATFLPVLSISIEECFMLRRRDIKFVISCYVKIILNGCTKVQFDTNFPYIKANFEPNFLDYLKFCILYFRPNFNVFVW